MPEIWDAMQSLKKKRTGNSATLSTISVVITLEQTIFKCDLMHAFTEQINSWLANP